MSIDVRTIPRVVDLTVGALLIAAMGCGSPSSPQVPPVPEVAASTAIVANDCPPSIDCHPEWRSCHCTLDARGELSTFEADIDGDGRPNFRRTNVYDVEGALLRWEHDSGADGLDPMVCTFTPPCPPPHPNESCECGTAPREVSEEYLEQRLREAREAAARQ